ncbi:hypothetical protein ScPMuIL_011578 [Solemya velum]
MESIFIPNLCQLKEELHIIDNFNRWTGDLCEGLSRSARRAATVRILRALGRSPVGGCAGLNDLRELLMKVVFAVVAEQDEHDATSAATRISNRVDHKLSELHQETKKLKMVINKHIAMTKKLQKIPKISFNLNKKIMTILQTETEGILLKLKTIADNLRNQPNPLVQIIERTDTEAITNELMKSLTTEYWYADVKQFTRKSEPPLPKCIIRPPSTLTYGGPHSKMEVSLIADQFKGKTVKQKFVDRETKIGFGWQRRFAGGPKNYGFFYTDNMKLACTYCTGVPTVLMYLLYWCNSVLTVLLYLLYRCTHCTDVPTVLVYLLYWCTYCTGVPTVLCTYCNGVPTVLVYLLYWCTHCTGVLTVLVYLLYWCTHCTDVPTVLMYLLY